MGFRSHLFHGLTTYVYPRFCREEQYSKVSYSTMCPARLIATFSGQFHFGLYSPRYRPYAACRMRLQNAAMSYRPHQLNGLHYINWEANVLTLLQINHISMMWTKACKQGAFEHDGVRLGTRGINCHQNGNHSRSLICVPFWVGGKKKPRVSSSLVREVIGMYGWLGARAE